MTAIAQRQSPCANAIRHHRLIVILRRIESRERLLTLVDELADAGARLFEVTFDDPASADALRACADLLAERRDGPFVVGAGTIRTEEQVRQAIGAGASLGSRQR